MEKETVFEKKQQQNNRITTISAVCSAITIFVVLTESFVMFLKFLEKLQSYYMIQIQNGSQVLFFFSLHPTLKF
jgi:hypothetical protein